MPPVAPSDRLTMKSLLIYLMNDENSVLDPSVFDQYQDMRKPFNHYFINSSHNTYLNGLCADVTWQSHVYASCISLSLSLSVSLL